MGAFISTKNDGPDWTEYSGGELDFEPTPYGRLAIRSWCPTSPRRIVACLHGIGAHSLEFAPLGEYLAARGTAVYAVDFPGCGDSEGPRGVIQLSAYRGAVRTLLESARRRQPGVPLFLLGHSLGGTIALWYAARWPEGLAGLVLAAPGLRARRPPSLGLAWKVALRCLLAPRTAIALDLEREPDPDSPYQRYFRQDGRHVQAWTPASFGALARWYWGARRTAHRLRLPVLIAHGESDLVADPEASRRLFEWAGSKDKRLVLLPGAGHGFYDALGPIDTGLFTQEQREQFLGLAAEWLGTY